MTIRKYLFLLISSLLLLVALFQVALIFYFKNTIEDEVERRGKHVANKLINMAIESYGEDIANDTLEKRATKDEGSHRRHKDNVLIEVYKRKEATPVYIFEVTKQSLSDKSELNTLFNTMPDDVRAELIDLANNFSMLDVRQLKSHFDGYSIQLSTRPNIPKHLVRQHLKRQIARIYNEPFNDNLLVNTEQDPAARQLAEKEMRLSDAINNSMPFLKPSQYKDKKVINKLSSLMITVIALTTILGFILVYFFSKRFSQPLQNLATGFKQLEQGNSSRVEVDGVEEVKTTIERFNKMSQKLEELAESKKRLQQQQHFAEISDVSKGIAHALRNPIHTIGLAAEQLTNDDLPADTKQKLLTRIKNKINQLDKSIKALLTITAGEIDRNSTIVISSVINDVILELKQSHDLTHGELDIVVDLNKELKIIGSNNEIRSIFHTLIYNAYESSVEAIAQLSQHDSSPESNKIRIEIITVDSNGHAVIYVNDYGSGMKPDIEATLFQPHVSSKSEGAGMGLYISKRIAELYYQGNLTVKNTVQEGKVTGVQARCELHNAKQKDQEPQAV